MPYIDPRQVMALVADKNGTIYLDSNSFDNHFGRYSFIVFDPLDIFISDTGANNFEHHLAKWSLLLEDNQQTIDISLPPFTGGLMGYLSYDLSHKLEHAVSHRLTSAVPYYWLGLYNQVIAFDLCQQQCYLMVSDVVGYTNNVSQQLTNLLKIYSQAQNVTLPSNPTLPPLSLHSNFTQQEYLAAVSKAINYIKAGDIFEVNLAQCFSAIVPKNYNLWTLYQKLARINSAPFSAYLNLGELKIASASPERFLTIKNNQIEVRPIKGTLKRSADTTQDAKLKLQLANSCKDVAENIMIVDLMRNDLSKVCIPASIIVSQLAAVESFVNVHHLVSVITGELDPDKSVLDAIFACFPGGSITGAPKIRSMQIIDELEPSRRGVYCGNIGYIGFNQQVDLSIAIRTIVQHKHTVSFSVGGAITLASDSQSEYQETLLKGEKLMESFA